MSDKATNEEHVHFSFHKFLLTPWLKYTLWVLKSLIPYLSSKIYIVFFLFDLILYVSVNSYGHVETVKSTKGKLD